MKTRRQNITMLISAVIMWVIPTLFFLYEYILRVSPSAMIHELQGYYGIDSAAFGFIVSLFYYAYGPMQLPAGLMIDRFGPRIVVCIMLPLCILGGALFAYAQHPMIAGIARFLIGFSAAFSFVATVRVIRNWFTSRHFALMTGVTIMLGTSGAILGEGPIAKSAAMIGWHQTLWAVSLLGIPLALFAFFILRDHPSGHIQNIPEKTQMGIWKNLIAVFKNAQTWFVAFYAFCMTTPTNGFGALWGTSYLSDLYSISTVDAASLLSFIFIGWVIGAPLFGWMSDKIGRRKQVLLYGAVGAAMTMMDIIYFPSSSIFFMGTMLLLFGIFSGAVAVSYTTACEINHPFSAGAASGLTNMFAMSGAIFVQPFIGWVLDITNNYVLSLTVLPLCLLGAIFIAFFIQENHCVQTQ